MTLWPVKVLEATARSCAINVMRFLRRVEVSEERFFPSNSDSGAPFTAWRMEANTFKAGAIPCLRLGITDVLRLAALAEIGESIVSRVAIRMVKVARGPGAVGIQPSKAVRQIARAKQRHVHVTGFIHIARGGAHPGGIGSPHKAGEISRSGVVGKKFFEAITSKHRPSPVEV